MNLRGIANGVTSSVNPNVPLVVQISTGYTTAANGQRSPSYAAPVTVQGQVQALSNKEIQHLDALNIQDARNAIYVNGQLNGLVREENMGGDLITDPAGNVWLVAIVLENWPDWCKVAVVRQNPQS
jgi:hypothetical protein